MSEPIRYPTYSELIFINGRILQDEALQTGKKKVRDIDMLQAAEARPQASAFGQDAYTSLTEKAAVLLHSIARNHPFTDGNKRTATVGALFLLAINGSAIDWIQTDALDWILDIAKGRMAWEDLEPKLTTLPIPPYLEADIERDTILIDTIIEQQKWLLDELEER